MKVKLLTSLLALTAIISSQVSMAATAVDLSKQPATVLALFMPQNHLTAGSTTEASVAETNRVVDFNQTTHIRVAQTYGGYPVWGSDAIVHIQQGVKPLLAMAADKRYASKVSMDGVMYRNLNADLNQAPAFIFNHQQADKAQHTAIQKYKDTALTAITLSAEESKLIVYLDQKQLAHWAYRVTFKATPAKGMPAKPVYILDALSMDVYPSWNDLKTANVAISGGGFGGNGNMGKMIYDGGNGHRPKLAMERDNTTKSCFLRNSTVVMKDVRSGKNPSFRCEKPDATHNNVYWNTTNDETNGGYSPNNDGLYSNSITREMYMSWFKVQMLANKNGTPQKVTFYVHDDSLGQNAYYENAAMHFGEGDDESYPVVAPSIVAHEMSHGFTEQHANLIYNGESGGLNESFSDMADKAIEYYVYGKNNWDIDPEVLKPGGRLLRYMDKPTKDCDGRKPGDNCSIEHMKDYRSGINVHFSSGIYNKAFYLLSTKWNTHKAFEVMTQANLAYWTSNTSFANAACGVLKATKDYHYNEQDVKDVMKAVGVVTSNC